MATGPEHYTEAEQHLAYAMSGGLGMETDFHLAAALVHATLAHAAATALNDADGGTSPDDYRAWRRVASVELATEHRDPEATGTEADTEAYVEAYVEIADAERYALRDEYVNAAGPDPEVALNVRDRAIGCITEKLRELARIENALHANHARATRELGGMSYQTYSDHREAAELNYVTADYYELLVEAITSGSLFDELDKQFPRDEPMTNRDVDPVNVDECDAYADAYSDTPIESGS